MPIKFPLFSSGTMVWTQYLGFIIFFPDVLPCWPFFQHGTHFCQNRLWKEQSQMFNEYWLCGKSGFFWLFWILMVWQLISSHTLYSNSILLFNYFKQMLRYHKNKTACISVINPINMWKAFNLMFFILELS